jgi:hypothetical protein
MNWIRIAVAIGDDPDIHDLADALNVPVSQAVGLVVCTLAKFPEHAPDGNLAQLRASLVERWAGWDGERGRFDAELRRIFLKDGVWTSWEKHNGRALQKLERDRERLRTRREESSDSSASVAHLSRNGRAVVAGTDGRTDEVQLRGGRKRHLNGNDREPYVPPPFCSACGQGMGKATPDATRLTILHAEGCPNAA